MCYLISKCLGIFLDISPLLISSLIQLQLKYILHTISIYSVLFYNSGYGLSWWLFHVTLKRTPIQLLLGEVFDKSQLVHVDCAVVHFFYTLADFLLTSSINHQEKCWSVPTVTGVYSFLPSVLSVLLFAKLFCWVLTYLELSRLLNKLIFLSLPNVLFIPVNYLTLTSTLSDRDIAISALFWLVFACYILLFLISVSILLI